MEIQDILYIYQDKGFEYLSLDEQNFLREYIEKNSEYCYDMYRGIVVAKDYHIEVGQKIKFQELFASFTDDWGVAKKFAGHEDIEKLEDWQIPHGIIFELEEGQGIEIASITDVEDEREWLLLDNEYEVIEIEEVEKNLLLVKITA